MAALISKLLFLVTLTLLGLNYNANAEIRGKTQRKINRANRYGPFLGIVTQSNFQKNLLLEHPSFTSYNETIEFAGRVFTFGGISGERVVVVVSGSSLINTGITTQLLLSLFRIKGVIHYGLAGSVDPSLHIGDVTIPQFWSHSGLWVWQRFLDGPQNKLPLEDSGDFSRKLGYLKFADYAVYVLEGLDRPDARLDNSLNNIWFQEERVYPFNSTLEERERIFWVPVNATYYEIANDLESLDSELLEKCVNPTNCLATTPEVSRVPTGTSASIYVDNAAFGVFLNDKFNVGPVDMDSAAVALACHQQKKPFIIIKAISDLVGRGSVEDANSFGSLAAKNSVTVTVEFVKLLQEFNVSRPGVFSL
ncbi:Adenosylhomocysteine nucleosidase [Handroanthus impetiginosus]|uniref:Adenosylhomocysteine nucleosidase n=1 Tax=Handroanthus impetiginosus TaxID=429701 RepID=A0A2G9FXE5_9LAMI|nr:Adenosylhomocysteine nucleosidase [Handroanthus impetiginosus]